MLQHHKRNCVFVLLCCIMDLHVSDDVAVFPLLLLFPYFSAGNFPMWDTLIFPRWIHYDSREGVTQTVNGWSLGLQETMTQAHNFRLQSHLLNVIENFHCSYSTDLCLAIISINVHYEYLKNYAYTFFNLFFHPLLALTWYNDTFLSGMSHFLNSWNMGQKKAC